MKKTIGFLVNMQNNIENNKNIQKKQNKDKNLICQIIQLAPIYKDNLSQIPREWTTASTQQSVQYQKIFKSSHENFIKNCQILFMRYELFHLCLAELIYESRGKSGHNSYSLGQISKIHEQLFKVGLKNLSNIFESENYLQNSDSSGNFHQKENNTLIETENKVILKTKKDALINFNLKKKKT